MRHKSGFQRLAAIPRLRYSTCRPSAGPSCLDPGGGVPEWLNGTVSKTVVPLRVPRVRIPPPPPTSFCKLAKARQWRRNSFSLQRGLARPTELQRLAEHRFWSLNGFRLFLTEPRPIWFGRIKLNSYSALTFGSDRTFYRNSAARHSIRDIRSGRCAARGCAGLRMRQPEWPDRKGLQNRLLSTPGENGAATTSRIAR